MNSKTLTGIVLILALVLAAVQPAGHRNREPRARVLPAPAAIKVDGSSTDWDLSVGIFACGDCETQREKFAVWFHANYDAENLYILSRGSIPRP